MEDILTLRYTLLQYRKQLEKLIRNFFDTEFAYSKVELREDYNQLKQITDKLKAETILLNQDLHELIQNCQVLVQQTTEILSERDGYYSEWKYAKDILTPRPDWDKCSDLIPNWMNLSKGKSSDELVNVIIKEIKPSNHVRQRLIGLIVKNIWSNRILSKSKSLFADCVHDYLTQCFQNIDIESACSIYRNNYEINLFWKILIGQIEENVYHYQMKEYARILQAFIRFAKQSTINFVDLRRILEELYPHWTNKRIDRLMRTIPKNETNDVEYILLFIEDDQGNVGEFLKSIREELEFDKYEYVEQINPFGTGLF